MWALSSVAYGRHGLCIKPCLKTWRHELVEGCSGDAMVGFVVAVVVVDVVVVLFVRPMSGISLVLFGVRDVK